MDWKPIAVVGFWFACSSCILGANPGVEQPDTGNGGDVVDDVAGDTASDTVADTTGEDTSIDTMVADSGPAEDTQPTGDTGRDSGADDTGPEDTSGGDTDGGALDCTSPGNIAGCKSFGYACTSGSECLSGNCLDGACAQTIFVTNQTFDGNLGGLAGAGSKCNSDGVDGTWGAVLSTSDSDAIDRITFHFPLYNRRGEKVADSKNDLWKIDGKQGLEHAIRYDLRANQVQQQVWTGTKDDGEADKTCEFRASWDKPTNLLISTKEGTIGQSGRKDIGWTTQVDAEPCGTEAAIYCIDGQ